MNVEILNHNVSESISPSGKAAFAQPQQNNSVDTAPFHAMKAGTAPSTDKVDKTNQAKSYSQSASSGVWAQLTFLVKRQRQRRLLLTLDDRLLRDIGADRATASIEGGKWFWQN